MKHKTRFSMLLLLTILAVLGLSACGSYSPVKGSLVMGNTYRLASGDTLNDSLTIMGGTATLERDSTVNGDVSVLGGTLDVDGTINGDISVMGGAVRLNDNAVVHGSISEFGGSISRASTAQVDGSTNRTGPNAPAAPTAPMRPPRVNFDLGAIFAPFLAIFRALALAALAILVYLFAGRPMERVSEAIQGQAVVSGGIGLLTIVVVPALLLILAITIILLPISLLGLLLVGISIVFGWLAMGLLTGRQIANWLHQSWSEPLNAGVGTLVLTLLASIFNVIPCIGWLATFVIGIVGLGAVIVTRFGTMLYSGPSSTPGGHAPRPRPAPPSSSPYPTSGAPTDQYYAPHVVTPVPPVDLEAVPNPPVDVAPDLDFLNTDQPSEGDQSGEDQAPKGPDEAEI